ncbi:MAG: CCA tRNA nucleotidyltransferase [archaeon]|jgi:tRNA nucleotidyltransferase (CCA-adding enzyme)|nr:CCA tRNA nucleotidyltransferase [archaeon]
MPSKKQLLESVLKKVTPGKAERERQGKLANKIIEQIKGTEGKHVDVMLCGSNARDTHLRGDNDLDIFVLFPKKMGREEFEKEGLKIGKKVFRGKQWEKAFSEHPYIRGKIDGFDVEIVPSYKVVSAELLQSAVDRSPFHNKFLQENLKEKHKKEARLLKQFLKGIKAYGADIRASSVPGYVVELLVLEYGSFLNVLKAVSKWRQEEVIDIEGHLREREARKKFKGAALIVIDPVDKNRNVAAALSLNQFSRTVAAARAFLKKPNERFFFGKKEKSWSAAKLKKMLEKKELVAVRLGYPKGALSDIIWGQIQRLARKIETQLRMNEFNVLRSEAWTDEKQAIVIVIEVESRVLQKTTKKIGPFVTDEKNSLAFLSKHTKLIAGPRIEKGKWVIEIPRTYTRIEKFLQAFLKKEKRVEKDYMRKALNKKCRILQESNLIELFKKNKEFAKFLTSHLKGEEEFL